MSGRQPTADKKRAKFELIYRKYQQAFAEGDFALALATARQARTLSNSPEIVHSEALCLHRLGRSQEAYVLATAAPAADHNENYRDLMADICGALGKGDEVRLHGAAALAIRDRKVESEPRYPIPEGGPPTGEGKKRIIAYSLFGGSPRYCEVAIMNCAAAASLLPDWQCRFYCDETVPLDVRRRIVEAGGEVVLVDAATQQAIPALMWRFLAADDPGVSRFLMRDADSLIGAREAAAVNTWLGSGKWFHVMRDYYTHTELILAGLWGGSRGVIPDMRKEIAGYLVHGRPDSRHVDQHFLRKRIWPTVRQSVLSHDSQFNFLNNEPFPHVPSASLDPKHHVGANLSTCSIGGRLAAGDGETARVSIFDEQGRLVCAYEVKIRDGRWQLPVPDSYADRIESREWSVRFG